MLASAGCMLLSSKGRYIGGSRLWSNVLSLLGCLTKVAVQTFPHFLFLEFASIEIMMPSVQLCKEEARMALHTF